MHAINLIKSTIIINFLLVNIVLLVFLFFMLLKLIQHLQFEILTNCLYGPHLDEIWNHFRKTTNIENHCVHIFKTYSTSKDELGQRIRPKLGGIMKFRVGKEPFTPTMFTDEALHAVSPADWYSLAPIRDERLMR